MNRLPILVLLLALLGSAQSQATKQTPAAKPEPVVMEYYYTVKWGYQDEFLRLFKKNHLPLLKKAQELGEILKIEMVQPADHLPEPSRWDFKMIITFRDIDAAFGDQSSAHAVIRKQMYPDQALFEREEQRRFEILLAHWDVPIDPIDLNK